MCVYIGEKLASYHDHGFGEVQAVALTDELCASCNDHLIKVWDAATGETVRPGHPQHPLSHLPII